jgi:formylglycine-generating enzyme required for sulfatase activity
LDRESITTARTDRGVVTLDGSLQGSVRYMAPEQARGDVSAIDARTDVFGLGTILYQILTGEPLYPERSFEDTLELAQNATITPPSTRCRERQVPTELEAICTRALAADKDRRFASAREFSGSLQAYIEGIHDAERRAAEAERLLGKAADARTALQAATNHQATLIDRETELRSHIKDHDPEEEKQELWQLLEELTTAREAVSRLFDRTSAAYQAVLSVDANRTAARGALADLYHEKMLDAEERDDRDAMRLYEGLVRQYQDGQYEISLEGQAVLKLDSDPTGATVILSRYVERGLLLVETDTETIGTTPLEVSLKPGSYLAVLKKDGHDDVRYPFVLDRRPQHVAQVNLYRHGTIPEGFVQIPAGESLVGGTSRMFSTAPRERRWIPEFFVGRFPVTFEEYCRFLDAVDDAPERELVPVFHGETYVEAKEGCPYKPIARLTSTTPVFAVQLTAMRAYCSWLAREFDENARLLTEAEWERCARGADGRVFPWGNGFDWSLCLGGRSHPDKSFPQSVGTFARDVSPLGVRDLAGGMREACDGRVDSSHVPFRGGSWYNPHTVVFRADARTSMRADIGIATDAGFRACFSTRKSLKGKAGAGKNGAP